jgi:hypothetical protein
LQELPPERLSDRVEALPFDGHLVLVKDGCELMILNGTGRLIWEGIAGGATAAEVAHGLAKRFSVCSARAKADVEMALAEWRSRDLIGRLSGSRWSALGQPGAPRRRTSHFAAAHTYALCGRPVRFRFEAPEAEHLIHPLLSPWEVCDVAAIEVIDLYRDGVDHVVAANGVEIGRDRLAEEVFGLALGRVLEVSYPWARWLAVFHAGAVGNAHHAIVMPGASGSGKSTLTAALVHSGLRYLSDDIVPLDGASRVLPVPVASSLKPGSWPILAPKFSDLERLPTHRAGDHERRYLDLSDHAPVIAEDGVAVRALVFPQYQPKGLTQLEALRPGQALERILEAQCWISLDRADLATTLEFLLEIPSYSLRYGSLDDAILAIRELLFD